VRQFADQRIEPASAAVATARPAAPNPPEGAEERRVRRHARREQLYVAVRESMTHSGVLSASYKFKVLSLDQRGDQFLVMMDVDQSFGHQAEKLAEIENKIIQTAKARFEILVTSLYWRIDTHGVVGRPKVAGADPGHNAGLPSVEPSRLAARKPASRYDPIQDDEVAAFKQALAAASANSPVATDGGGKIRSGPRSYTLLTGFEDTEMPESSAAPVLSNTQYGDLN
jgi:hypothetical protein